MIERIVRAYYEENGTFDGIEKLPYFDMIKNKAEKDGIDLEEFYYLSLGYSNDIISAKERYTIRKAVVQDDKETFRKIFNIDESIKITEELMVTRSSSLNAYGMTKIKNEIHNLDLNIIKALSNYYKYSKELEIYLENKRVFIPGILQSHSIQSSRIEIQDFMKSPAMKKIIENLKPRFIKSDVEEPVVFGGNCYCKEVPSVAKQNRIVYQAILDSIWNTLSIPLGIRKTVIVYSKVPKVNFSTPIHVAELSTMNYLLLIDIAHSLGVTFKKLYELCNLNYPSVLSQLEDTNCIITMEDKDAVKISSLNSKTPNDYILTDVNMFATLYSNESLNSLDWKNGRATISVPDEIFLDTLYSTSDGRDFRG